MQEEEEPGLMDVIRTFFGFGTRITEAEHDQPGESQEEKQEASGQETGLASILLGLLGLNDNSRNTKKPAAPEPQFHLCDTCKIEFKNWEAIAIQQAEEAAEEEFKTRMVYDALACFASGALLGIALGILRD